MAHKNQIRILSESIVRQCMSMPEAIKVNRVAFESLSSGTATVPPRIILATQPLPGPTLFKPAHVHTPEIQGLGLKVASVRSANAELGISTVPGVILLVQEQTGFPEALLDASYLTALRTAAGSGAATDLLALPTAKNLLVFGAGAQARLHIEAMFAVRNISKVTIWNRSTANAHKLVEHFKNHGEGAISKATFEVVETAEQVRGAVKEAHIIVAATNSSHPLFQGKDLQEGTHINAVGSYLPSMQELDEETVRRAVTVTDNPPEEILKGTGDYSIPLSKGIITHQAIVGQIGEAFLGKIQVRKSDKDITIFKSVGNAVQDIVTAAAVNKNAIKLGLGQISQL